MGAPKLAELAEQEIHDLTHGDDADLVVDVLGALTAAAGPLSVRDLVALRSDGQSMPTAADTRHVRRLVEDRAARSLERIGPAGTERYQFAHLSLLAYAQADDDLSDPEYRQRIHHWAAIGGLPAGLPVADGGTGTPRYLLDTYPSTLASDPQRLAELTCDVGWIEAAVGFVGVDRVLADLRPAAAANRDSAAVAAMLAAVTAQAYNLRLPRPMGQPGYVLRQLGMQAAELAEDELAEEIRSRLESRSGPGLVPSWTTRRASRALSVELGRHDGPVLTVAVAADGRAFTGGSDGRLLVWDPAGPGPGADPVELGHRDHGMNAVAMLADGRVVTGGADGWVLVWDPASPGADAVEVGRHDGFGGVRTVAVLGDGRVVTFGGTGGY